MITPDRTIQIDAFLTRGRIGAEVHVLDNQINVFASQQFQALLRRSGNQGADVMQSQQHIKCGSDCRVVIDHQYGTHGSVLCWASTHACLDAGKRERVT